MLSSACNLVLLLGVGAALPRVYQRTPTWVYEAYYNMSRHIPRAGVSRPGPGDESWQQHEWCCLPRADASPRAPPVDGSYWSCR